MWALLVPLISQILGENGPLGKLFKIKADQIVAEDNYKLELLKSQTERDTAAIAADTSQRSNYLNATSQGFRQGTFYWLSAIMLYSILRPESAQIMWQNFRYTPDWFQYIYLGMLSVIWGLPIARENVALMFSSIGRGIESRREYKLEKAKINRLAVFEYIKSKWFPKGMNQQAVEILDSALDAGEIVK